jgi:hypothetical protein
MLEPDLIELFAVPLERLQLRYVITGSVAAMLYGEPRVTHDIDFVVFLRLADISRLPEAYPSPEFYLPPQNIIAREVTREEKGQFNVIHPESGLKADFYTVRRDELDSWAFRNARQYTFEKTVIRLAPPEYVILRKLEYYREGGSAIAGGMEEGRLRYDLFIRTALPPHEPHNILVRTALPPHEPHEILVRTTLPHGNGKDMGNKAGIDMGNRFRFNLALFRGHDLEKDLMRNATVAVCEVGVPSPTQPQRTVPTIWIEPQSRLQMDQAFRTGRASRLEGPISPAAAKSAADGTQMAEADSPVVSPPSQLGQSQAGGVLAQGTSKGAQTLYSDRQQLAQTPGPESAEMSAADSPWPSLEAVPIDRSASVQPRVDSRFQRLVPYPGRLSYRTTDRTRSVQPLWIEHSSVEGPKLGASSTRVPPALWAIRLSAGDPCGQRQSLWIHGSRRAFAPERLVDGAGNQSGIYCARAPRAERRPRTNASGVQGRNDASCVARSTIATATNGSMAANLQPSATARRSGTANACGGLSLAKKRTPERHRDVFASLAGAASQEQWADQMEGPEAVRRRSLRWLQCGAPDGARGQNDGVLCGRIDRRTLGRRHRGNASGGLCASRRAQMSMAQTEPNTHSRARARAAAGRLRSGGERSEP